MPYPPDVLLLNEKYYGAIIDNSTYNIHHDMSLTSIFALSGEEHGVCFFLSLSDTPLGGIPGHYLGYLPNSGVGYPDPAGILAVALDTTGLFALSGVDYGGVGHADIKQNSLIIRDYNNNVAFNEPLSSLHPSLSSWGDKNYITIRIRVTNAGKKLHVDLKPQMSSFITMATVDLDNPYVDDAQTVHWGWCFCSPLSSTTTAPSTLYIRATGHYGTYDPPTYETTYVEALSPPIKNFNTVVTPLSYYTTREIYE